MVLVKNNLHFNYFDLPKAILDIIYMKVPQPFQHFKQGLFRLFFLFAILFLSFCNSYAQPRIVWDTTYGGSGTDIGQKIARIPGGFIAVSHCGSSNFNVLAATDPDGSGHHGADDFWIKKLNDNGQIIWQNSLGGLGTEVATSVAPTADGGYIIAGYLGFMGSASATGDVGVPDADLTGLQGGADIWVVKLSAAGIMQWHNIIGGSAIDMAYEVIQTSDGGYLVVGESFSTDKDALAVLDADGSGNHGMVDIIVVKLRANGTIQWRNLLGGSKIDFGASCVEVANGYLIAGASNSTNGDLALPDVDGTPTHGSNYDYWVVKLDFNGNQLWDNAIGGSGIDRLNGLIATTDGNFVLIGRGESFNNGDAAPALDVDGLSHGVNPDFWAVKINPAGGIIWRNHIGTLDWDEIQSASIACDGGIILSGYSLNVAANGDKTMANPNGNRCPWLVKLNNAGKIEWDYAYASAGPSYDGPNHVTTSPMTRDYYVIVDSIGGDYFVLTTSQNQAGANKTAPNKGSFDSWLLKFTFELNADFKSDTACFGTPTQFTDLSTFTNIKPLPIYSWNFGDAASGGLNTSNAKNPTHTFTAPGTYTVTQIIQYECKYDTILKTALVPLPPTVNFSNYSVCNGSSVILSPIVNPPGGTFLWSPGGQNTSSISVSPGTKTTYSVVYTDLSSGCANSAATTVAVNPVPLLNISSQSNVLCNGGETGAATVNAANGLAPFTYAWNPGAQLTAAATGLSAQTYSATVTDNNGCSSIITATITEPTLLQAFIPAKNNIICYAGNTGWATAAGLGGIAPYTYAWSGIPSQTTQTATNLIAGTYSVSITDKNGCTALNSTNITQAPAITATVTVLNNPLCNGDATGVLSLTLSNGNSPYTYKWSPGAHSTANITGLTANAYSVSVVDVNGCTAESSANITAPPLLTMALSSTPDYCQSSNGTITILPAGGNGAYTFNWNPSNQITSTATGLSAGTYTATLTDNNGCSTTSAMAVIPIAVDTLLFSSITNARCNDSCDGSATLQLSGTANGPYNYSWNTVPPQNSLTATGLCAGTFVLTVSDVSGCADTMSVFISEPSLLKATLTSTSTLCYGDNTGTASVSTSGGTPNYSYSWDDGQIAAIATGFAAGTHSVTVTDNNGCSTTQTIQVIDAHLLVVNIIPSVAICEGQQATLNSNVLGGTPAYNYLWNTGQNMAGINTISLTVNSVYSLTVTDNNGCTAYAVTQVTVNPLPIVNFTSDGTAGCKPLCINFTNTTATTQTQAWNFGDAGSSTQANPNHCFTQTGSFNIRLTVTDNNGCSNSITQNNYIIVHPNPVASFTATPQSVSILNPIVYFTANPTGVIAWNWSFGDALGSSSIDQNTYYTYSDTGNYSVRLIVVNEFGCRDTADEFVRISPDFVLYVPNTFTPNGDGNNEEFIPMGMGVDMEKYEFYIYDRWGSQVFKSTNPLIGWDGRANGGKNIAQQDVYVWKVITTDVYGKSHRYEGHINLLK